MKTTNGTENVESKKDVTKEEVYAKYCLRAKEQLDALSLTKKKSKLSNWLFVLWVMSILFTLLIYFFMSGFNFQTFRELTDGSLGYWTGNGAFFLGLIFILIVETRKPDFVNINKVFEKADELIKNKKKNLKATAEEIDLLEIKEDNEL